MFQRKIVLPINSPAQVITNFSPQQPVNIPVLLSQYERHQIVGETKSSKIVKVMTLFSLA